MAGIQDPAVLAGVTEKQLQSTILDALGYMGWKTYHTFDSRRSNPGFPDIVAVKGGRVMAVELKSEKGKIRPEQIEWLDALSITPTETHLVRPSTMDSFLEEAALSGTNLETYWMNQGQNA